MGDLIVTTVGTDIDATVVTQALANGQEVDPNTDFQAESLQAISPTAIVQESQGQGQEIN